MVRRKITSRQKKTSSRKQTRRAFFIFLIVFCFIITTSLMLLHTRWFTVDQVVVNDTVRVVALDVQTLIDDHRNQKLLGLISQNNIVFLPRNLIERELQSRYPIIADLRFKFNGFSKLHVGVSEREETYVWCTSVSGYATPECYFMDETGFIFSRAPYFSKNKLLVWYGSDTLFNGDIIGGYFSDVQTLSTFALFADELSGIDISVKGIRLGEEYVHVYPETINGERMNSKTEIRFLYEDIMDLELRENVYNNIALILRSEPLKTEIATQAYDLEYIDMRFVDKVAYRFFSDIAN